MSEQGTNATDKRTDMPRYDVIKYVRDKKLSMRKIIKALASVAQLVRASFHKSKGYGFDSQSGHMPRSWVQTPIRVHTRGDQLLFLSHIDVSLPLSLSLPSPLSKSISMCLGEDIF